MTDRMVKVNELILQQLGTVIAEELEFPEALITILAVDTSPDLKHAKVFISILPDSQVEIVTRKLNNAVKLLQKELAGKISLRSLPRLQFIYDDTEKQAEEIDRLLDSLK
jgi:ribosome-binding factor A